MANQGGGYLSLLKNKELYYKQNPNDEDSIQWVVDLLDECHTPHPKHLNDLDDSKADNNIMICTHCNVCWEYGKIPGEKQYYIYSEFPRLGKVNYKICPNCSDWLFNR